MTVCGDCIHRERIPGSAHITCKKPPSLTADVEGKVKREQVEGALEELLDERSDDFEIVMKKSWEGCGIFPLNFDESIILACSNKEIEG